MIDELKLNYGHLFEGELLHEINNVGVFKEVPEGFTFIEIGSYIRSMPLLASGAVKILREYDKAMVNNNAVINVTHQEIA